MDLRMGGALRTHNWGGGDQCREEKKRTDSFQEHLLNRRLRPDFYFTASGTIFGCADGLKKPTTDGCN